MPSHYDDDDDRRDDRRRDRDRDRDKDRKPSRRREPTYEEEEIIEARRGPARNRDRDDDRGARGGSALVRQRQRDVSESSVEEVERDFPPEVGGGGYVRRTKKYPPPRRTKSHGDRYDEDSYDDRPRKKDKRRKLFALLKNGNLLTPHR